MKKHINNHQRIIQKANNSAFLIFSYYFNVHPNKVERVSDSKVNMLHLIQHAYLLGVQDACKEKLIDAFIKARIKRDDLNWVITSDNVDYENNKVEYICRWLNHSFMPFTKRQRELYELVLANYLEFHHNRNSSYHNNINP